MASVILRRDSEPGPGTGVCAIVVLYEDNSSRDAAIRLCKALERIFNAELHFEISWCRFKYFNDPAVAAEAAALGARADLILIATQRGEDLPLEIRAWFECWVPERESSAGALVLLQTSQAPDTSTASQSSYLYLLAQRANLDYISLSNSEPSFSSERNSQSNERPKGFLPVQRSEGFVRPQHYSHSGINE